MNDVSHYDLANEAYYDFIKEKIIAKRAIFFGRLEVYVNPEYVTIYGSDIEGKSFPELTYISNKFNVFDKNSILLAMGLNPCERYYIGYDKIYFDMNSTLSTENLIIANGIKYVFDLLKSEFEEFFEWINYNVQDYLLEFKEDYNV